MRRLPIAIACCLFASPVLAQVPVAPVFAAPISGGNVCEGPVTVSADHPGTLTIGYRLYVNGQQAQERPVAALVAGRIAFTLTLFAKTTPIMAISAYNAAGETASLPMQFTVGAKPIPTGLKWPASSTKATSFSWAPNGEWQSVALLSLTQALFFYTNGCVVMVTK